MSAGAVLRVSGSAVRPRTACKDGSELGAVMWYHNGRNVAGSLLPQQSDYSPARSAFSRTPSTSSSPFSYPCAFLWMVAALNAFLLPPRQ